ncbi:MULTISPECIES: dehydrogenase [Pectobacterium]|uniref:Dehydrogenase n=1 Tax=Pectobacterium betavasculorum TaxID=55207 RepID=A0ABR4UU46_9GAMM|nr:MULTISPECIES: dehydrogenase [Pectobacterium]KFX12322.1 dehydrogenase [Pectobacterium betavasculorum]
MTWTDLGNPYPRAEPRPYKPVEWSIGSPFYLPAPTEQISLLPFDAVIERRRTRRQFGLVNISTLSHWLWLTGREQAQGHSRYGFSLNKRPVSSAGAIHPIHIILSLPDKDGWYLYLPDQHALAKLEQKNIPRASIRAELLPVIDVQEGITIRLVAEPGKTSAKYENAASLVWRDAGVLIGHMSLVAEALACNFCPLGITGHEWCQNSELQDSLAGVGLAIIGSR